MTSDEFDADWEQYMRETNHPEYDTVAETLRDTPGVRTVSWLYRDRYTICFEWTATDEQVADALSIAADHRFEACEREPVHYDKNRIDIEYSGEPTTITIH
jgi:hypothetical protein